MRRAIKRQSSKSNRSPVMHFALAVRPTQAWVDEHYGACAICGEAGRLELVRRPPYRSQPRVLDWLGIKRPRWMRNTYAVGCNECGSETAGGVVLNWNVHYARRRFADMGDVRVYVSKPARRKKGGGLSPKARSWANPRRARLVMQKEQRQMRRNRLDYLPRIPSAV